MRKFYYFFEIFYYNLHYYKPLVQIFEYVNVTVSGNDCKYCNVIESYKTVFKCFKVIFPYYIKHASCIQGCFKKASIKFKRSALRNEDEEY